MATATEYWQNTDGNTHITPQGKEFPEGDWVKELIPALFRVLPQDQPIIDYGCGPGRLTHLFDNKRYIGVDINNLSLNKARLDNWTYMFQWDKTFDPMCNGIYFLWTILLHIHDKDIWKLLENLSKYASYFVIGEVMDRRWRRVGNPPVFNRNSIEYAELFKDLGWEVEYELEAPYEHYQDRARMTVMVFKRA